MNDAPPLLAPLRLFTAIFGPVTLRNLLTWAAILIGIFFLKGLPD